MKTIRDTIERVQMLHNLAFIVGIQCIRRLIEKQELRIFINSAGYQQALTLSLADAVSLHADLRIIPQRKRIDEVTNVVGIQDTEAGSLRQRDISHGDGAGSLTLLQVTMAA